MICQSPCIPKIVKDLLRLTCMADPRDAEQLCFLAVFVHLSLNDTGFGRCFVVERHN